MPYSPTVQYVRSGERDYNPPALRIDTDFDKTREGVRQSAELMDKRYKESTDFYDIQKEEADNLIKAADGLEGKDHETMMNAVVKTRDELSQLFKGKKLKDYNTPEFQKLLFDKKKELASLRNGMVSSKDHLAKAMDFMSKAPHAKQGSMRERIAQYMEMSPAERLNVNLVNEFASDPMYFNAADYAISYLNKQGKAKAPVSRNTKDALIVTQREYLPSVYSVGDDGKELLSISDDTIQQMFEADPRFKSTMENMAFDTDKAKLMQDQGHTAFKEEDLFKFTKNYLSQIEALKSREVGDPEIRLKTTTKPTATDKKQDMLNTEITAIQDRFKTGSANPLQDYLGSVYSEFKTSQVGDGVYSVEPYVWEKSGSKQKSRPLKLSDGSLQKFTVNINDRASVQSLVNAIRQRLPATAESAAGVPAPSTKKTIKSSEIAEKAKNAGYSVDEYKKLLAERGITITD